MQVSTPDDWLVRLPRPGDTCVFSHGYVGFESGELSDAKAVGSWKRDALLFDRVCAMCPDPSRPPAIPIELSFGLREADAAVGNIDVRAWRPLWGWVQPFQTMTGGKWESI